MRPVFTPALKAALLASALFLQACDEHADQSVSSSSSQSASANMLMADVPSADHITNLPPGILDNNALKKVVAEQIKYKPEDQFSKSFDASSIVGRRFQITTLISDAREFTPIYDTATQRFTFSVGPTSNVEDEPIALLDFIEISKDQQYGPPTIMRTAFNYEDKVTPVQEETVDIGPLDPRLPLGVFKKGYPGVYGDLTKSVQMAPDKARIANDGMELEYEGVITQNKQGQVLECSDGHKGATIDYPYDTTWKHCLISGHLDRVAFVSPLAGVVAQWGESQPRHRGKDGGR